MSIKIITILKYNNMYLKEFTKLVKTNLGEHAIATDKFDWNNFGWDNELGKNNNKWREVLCGKPCQIHYEFTKRKNEDNKDVIYFEIHCHHLNQKKWNELCKEMKRKGNVDDKYSHPSLPTPEGSNIINHKDCVRLPTKKYSITEVNVEVKKMTRIVKEMYEFNDFIVANQKHFPC